MNALLRVLALSLISVLFVSALLHFGVLIAVVL